MMLWVVKANYHDDEVEFTLSTEKDDIKIALVAAQMEAKRIFDFGWLEPDVKVDGLKVSVKKHPSVL
jgi:hypothetical protein